MMKSTAGIIVACALICSAAVAQDAVPREAGVAPWESDIKSRIVRIAGYEGVTPLNMFIEPGTVVIWLNQYRGAVRVAFPDKKVSMACKSPVGFTLSDEGFFIADKLEFGAVSSLCFIERGTFAYYIERDAVPGGERSEGFRFEGKIVVQ